MAEIIDLKPSDLSKVIIIDSTLIKTYRACQKKYDYFNNLHLIPKSRKAAPSFGIAMHEGIAEFRRQRMKNIPFPSAFDIGQAVLQREYGKHMPLESQSEVMTDDRRSLLNAIRLYTGFCQHYEPMGYEYLHIETPFAIHIGKVMNKDVIYVGIIDAIIKSHGIVYVSDIKSTAMNISESYLDGFKLDQGLIGYVMAARELLGIDTSHALVHAFWVQKEAKGPRSKPLDEYYHTKPLFYDSEQLAEWLENTLITVEEIEHKNHTQQWSMDLSFACSAYGGCDYKNVCALPPSSRSQRLEMDFKKAIWTPLAEERSLEVTKC